MENRVIPVPAPLLLAPDLTASAKVVWMGLRLLPTARPGQLERLTGLSRHTILRGMADAKACDLTNDGPRVKVPAALLASSQIGAQSKVLYGILQATPGFHGQCGRFTYASLSALTQVSPNTLKRAFAELTHAGCLKLTQPNRVSPIEFTLHDPQRPRRQTEAAVAGRRLRRGGSGGEAIMQEYLSLLIDSDQFTDTARPGFLVNPLTGERLELDRFYPPTVAFEFNGDQHYYATGQYTQAEVDDQHLRDIMKAGICLYRGIQLVLIHPEDLSLQGMIKKVGRIMPLRKLEGKGPLIARLEEASLIYLASVQTARKLGS